MQRQIRRAESDRAVLTAQLWLLRTQRLANYCGAAYDQYDVHLHEDKTSLIEVARGDLKDATLGRERAAQSAGPQNDPAPAKKGKAKRPAKTVSADDWVRSYGASGVPGQGARSKSRHAKEITPFQQRLNRLKENAKATLAEKQKYGAE